MAKEIIQNMLVREGQQITVKKYRFWVKELFIPKPNLPKLNLSSQRVQNRASFGSNIAIIRLVLEDGKTVEIIRPIMTIQQIVRNLGTERRNDVLLLTTRSRVKNKRGIYQQSRHQHPLLQDLNHYILPVDAKTDIDSYWYKPYVKHESLNSKTISLEKKKKMSFTVKFTSVEQLSPNDDDIRRYGILRRFMANSQVISDEFFVASDKEVINDYLAMADTAKEAYLAKLENSYHNLDYL